MCSIHVLNAVLNLITMVRYNGWFYLWPNHSFSLVAMTGLGLLTYGMLHYVQQQTAVFWAAGAKPPRDLQ